jgi:hypothetical protein
MLGRLDDAQRWQQGPTRCGFCRAHDRAGQPAWPEVGLFFSPGPNAPEPLILYDPPPRGEPGERGVCRRCAACERSPTRPWSQARSSNPTGVAAATGPHPRGPDGHCPERPAPESQLRRDFAAHRRLSPRNPNDFSAGWTASSRSQRLTIVMFRKAEYDGRFRRSRCESERKTSSSDCSGYLAGPPRPGIRPSLRLPGGARGETGAHGPAPAATSGPHPPTRPPSFASPTPAPSRNCWPWWTCRRRPRLAALNRLAQGQPRVGRRWRLIVGTLSTKVPLRAEGSALSGSVLLDARCVSPGRYVLETASAQRPEASRHVMSFDVPELHPSDPRLGDGCTDRTGGARAEIVSSASVPSVRCPPWASRSRRIPGRIFFTAAAVWGSRCA